MFTLDTRVSTALEARPELRQLLPAFHPAFEKLNHPVLGRVMPRLVNVRDAARVAGVDAQALLDVMNLPGPPEGAQHPAPDAPFEAEPEPAWLRGAPIEELDLHEMLAGGAEPFPQIMAALRALPTGGVLRVHTPFEPAPLRTLLGGRGWESHAHKDERGFQTAFFRRPDSRLDTGAPADIGTRLTEGPDGAELDVRGLEPPQPLRAVLATLDGGTLPLRVRHHREPALLFPRLEARGLRWTLTRDGDDHLIDITAAPNAP
jgi:hypothetical protein